jgi:hypothetical protein
MTLIRFRVDWTENGRVRARSSNTSVEVEADDALALRDALLTAVRAAHGPDVHPFLVSAPGPREV